MFNGATIFGGSRLLDLRLSRQALENLLRLWVYHYRLAAVEVVRVSNVPEPRISAGEYRQAAADHEPPVVLERA